MMLTPSVRLPLTLLLCVGWTLFGEGLLAAEKPRVELEVLIDAGGSPLAPQQWMEVLKDIAASVRIRQGRDGEELKISNEGTEASPNYRVTAAITSRNQLMVPGGKLFNMSDKRALATFLDKVASGGDRPGSAPAAFGLTEKQLVAVHSQLAGSVSVVTKGKPSSDVIEAICRDAKIDTIIDGAAREGIRSQEPVLDELTGVSAGTALAAVLRPLGLVFAPTKTNANEVQLRIADVRSLEQSWPIGWPVDKSPNQIAPDLFKFLKVDITDVTAEEALDAIQPRLQMPFLFDHNSIARQRIDVTRVKVNVPQGKTFYKSIIDKVLTQAKLKSELRMDEAEKPFLWITSAKKS